MRSTMRMCVPSTHCPTSPVLQEPVVGERLGGLVRLAPVAGERAGVARLDLVGLGVEAQLGARVRHADRPDLDLAGQVQRGDGAVLGHPVELEDGDADAHEELQHLGGDRRRPRRGVAAAAQADALLQGPEHERVPDGVAHPAADRVVAAVGDLGPADLGRRPQPAVEHEALRAAGIVALDEDAGVQLLPDARDGEEQRRLDLTQVGGDGLDRLGEVEDDAARHHVPGREHPLGDVAERQVGHDHVARARAACRRAADRGAARGDSIDEREVGVGEHRPLRRPRGARRVHEGDHVVGGRFGHPLLDGAGVLCSMLAAELEEIVPRRQPLVLVGRQSARLDVDDRLQRRAGRRVGEHLVDLLLVFGEVHGGAGVAEQVLDLGGGVRRVETDGDATDRHRGDVEDHPLGPVLGVDRHAVAGLHAEGEEGVSGVDDVVPDVVPGVLLPDPEVLLTHRHLVRGAASPIPSERGDRHGPASRLAGRACGASAVMAI